MCCVNNIHDAHNDVRDIFKTNEDGLRTMVTNERQARELHIVRKRRE